MKPNKYKVFHRDSIFTTETACTMKDAVILSCAKMIQEGKEYCPMRVENCAVPGMFWPVFDFQVQNAVNW